MTEADRSQTGSSGLSLLRAELRAGYPAIDTRAVARIIGRAGWTTLPAPLLVAAGMVGSPPQLARTLARARVHGSHPLFSAEFYLGANPDVALSGAPAWLHYQTFGRGEGRSPHPLIDPSHLDAGLAVGSPAEAVDRYLAVPEAWTADPSPYVNARRFLVSGLWDGRTHPLTQLVTDHPDGPWVHQRLMMIDAGTADRARARLAAIGSVLLDHGSSPVSQIDVWSRPEEAAPSSATPEASRVIPGFFLGGDGIELWGAGDQVVSRDRSARRTPFETVTTRVGPTARGDVLVVFTASAGRAQLESAVVDAERGTVFAPVDDAQETSLRQLRRDRGREREVSVLSTGRQVGVSGVRVELVPANQVDAVAAWEPRSVAPASTAIVLGADERIRANSDPDIRALVVEGASLCVVDDRGLNSWLPTIQNREIVAVSDALLSAVAAFVPVERIRRRS